MTLVGAKQAREQREQLDRYLKWVAEEGGVEGPVRLETYMRAEQRTRVDWLRKHCVEASGDILEVGCSWGYVLAAVGGRVGIDINPANVLLAKILAPSKVFFEGDARELAFGDGSFHTAILAEVLEHLPFEDVPLALAEAHRVARATILITLPLDEQHAPSMKHQWVLTDELEAKIWDDWVGTRARRSRDEHFLYIEAHV